MPEDNVTESWLCIDCGVNTAPGIPPGPLLRQQLEDQGMGEVNLTDDSEVYMVVESVWKKAGMKPFGGCLCIGCLEKRLRRKLKPQDFDRRSAFENTIVSTRGTPRLLDRRKPLPAFMFK